MAVQRVACVSTQPRLWAGGGKAGRPRGWGERPWSSAFRDTVRGKRGRGYTLPWAPGGGGQRPGRPVPPAPAHLLLFPSASPEKGHRTSWASSGDRSAPQPSRLPVQGLWLPSSLRESPLSHMHSARQGGSGGPSPPRPAHPTPFPHRILPPGFCLPRRRCPSRPTRLSACRPIGASARVAQGRLSPGTFGTTSGRHRACWLLSLRCPSLLPHLYS